VTRRSRSPSENFLEILSGYGKLQLACTPRILEIGHRAINPRRISTGALNKRAIQNVRSTSAYVTRASRARNCVLCEINVLNVEIILIYTHI